MNTDFTLSQKPGAVQMQHLRVPELQAQAYVLPCKALFLVAGLRVWLSVGSVPASKRSGCARLRHRR